MTMRFHNVTTASEHRNHRQATPEDRLIDTLDVDSRSMHVPHPIERPKAGFWLATLALVACTGLALPFDLAARKIASEHPLHGEFGNLFQRAEVFGHGTGVLLILLTVAIACRPSVRRMVWLAVAVYGAGLVADIIKCFVSRTRPHSFTGDNVFATFELLDFTVPATTIINHVRDSSHHAFPSAHTATAFGLAIGLASLFPRGRVWFYVMATLVACQRVLGLCHFPSDVVSGAALGLACGGLAMTRLALSEQHAPRPLAAAMPRNVGPELASTRHA